MYARLNAPPEHRHLWIEDPEGYVGYILYDNLGVDLLADNCLPTLLQLPCAISSKRPSAARSVGLPSYLFPWDLFLDSENSEEAIKIFLIAQLS